MPTGVFVVVSRCGEATAPIHNCSNIRTLSFILSQVDSSRHYNCQVSNAHISEIRNRKERESKKMNKREKNPKGTCIIVL